MPGLSKSRYTTYCQCEKALWLRQFKPEEQIIDESTEARFEKGNEVGDLAMGLLGPFTEVTSYNVDSDGQKCLDLKAMIDKTQQCLADGTENIAEASFSWNGNYCAVDILHKTDGGYAIYEVKSSSNLDHIDTYAKDVAYQKFVLTNCGIKVTGTYLVNINKEYVLDGELDIHDFFCINDIKEAVDNEYPLVGSRIVAALRTLNGCEPSTGIGKYCHKPYKCAFWDYCTRNVLTKQSVFSLYGIRFDKALEHMRAGRMTLEDMQEQPLTDMQRLQIECTLRDSAYIDKEGIRKFLSTLSYPLYFLDFETEQTIIPKYPGTRPNQQVTFQYSLHYIEHEGGELLHKEFLGESGKDPRRALAEQLCNDIPLNVCTTVYNDVFECSRLRELAAAFPDLAPHLLNIEEHIIDLIVPFRAGHYYVPSMEGSFSIKKVLPALFPDDPQLDYHNLSGGVQNGGEAMNIYPKIQFMSPEDQQAARKALLEYCCLDTFAMVKVWEKLLEVSK